MRIWLTAALVVLCCGGQGRAASVPSWAIGDWIAVSTIQSATQRGFGENFLRQIPAALGRTQLHVEPDFIAASFSPYNLKFDWGLNLGATIQSVPLRQILEGIDDPYVYGQELTYDPSKPVVAAKLLMDHCAEDGARFETQTTVPIYRFSKLRRACTEYSLFEFPDPSHLAIWNKMPWGANRGLVIFERVAKPPTAP